MRCHPSVSYTERIAQMDDVLPLRFPIKTQDGETLSSIKIRKGQVSANMVGPMCCSGLTVFSRFLQVINVPTIAINQSSVWGPDAEVFRPERWINPGELPPPTSLTQGWSGLFSFIEGPRICIGLRLGE